MKKGLAFDVTDNCNLRCVSCQGYTTLSRRNLTCMDFETFKRQTQVCLDDWDFMQIGNTAEPTIHPNFSDYLEYLQKEFHGKITILTNGTRLTKYADEINRSKCRINLSLDSVEPESYARIRKGAKLDNVLQGLSLLDRNIVDVTASFTLMRSNIVYFQAALDFCAANNISLVYRPMTLRTFQTSKGMALNLDHMLECLLFHPELLDAWRARFVASSSTVLPTQPIIRDVTQCNLHKNWLFMRADGGANICMKVFHPGLKEENLNNIWNSPNFSHFRNNVDKCRTPCRNCTYFEKCINLSMDNPESFLSTELLACVPDILKNGILAANDCDGRLFEFFKAVWDKINIVFKDDNASRKRGVSLQHLFERPEYVVLEELLNPETLLMRNQAITAESINALLDSLMNSFSISRLKTRLPSRRPKILVWGTGGMYYDLWASFITVNPCNYEIMGFIDSDANKWNTQIHELPVNPPEYLRNNQPDIIIIASCFYQTIRERAENLLGDEAKTQYIYGSNQLDAQDVIRILQHGDDGTPAQPTHLPTGTQA